VSKMPPVHPGEILMLDFIEPLGVTQNKVAVAIGVPPRRINEIVHGKRRITADTALRLARYFGTSDLFWSIFRIVSTSRPNATPSERRWTRFSPCGRRSRLVPPASGGTTPSTVL